MNGKCKMNGKSVSLPCSTCSCPLFGDCYAEYALSAIGQRPTNADRIRGMSDEELAQFLVRSVAKKCPPGDWNYDCGWDNSQFWAFWIRQPAEEASDGQTI